MKTDADLTRLAAYVASHDMPMVRVIEGAVEFASDVFGRDGAHWQELSRVRTIAEARRELGY